MCKGHRIGLDTAIYPQIDMKIATTMPEIRACYPAIHELRPHISEARFFEYVQIHKDYRLACTLDAGSVVAVAGFRIADSLSWGRYLYVEDLVTLASHRSCGHGAELLIWLKGYAATEGCAQLHLDSGIQRIDAHRSYERESMIKTGFHFATGILPDETAHHR